MDNVFMKKIDIHQVRHLKDITICLDDENMRHLILTGKNGSGKTSVLDAVSQTLDQAMMTVFNPFNKEQETAFKTHFHAEAYDVEIEFDGPLYDVIEHYHNGRFILAYYKDDRKLFMELPRHVEKVHLQKVYGIYDEPRREFVKYLLDMKMTEALAAKAGKDEKADKITGWFHEFEEVLREIYMDDSLKLEFDEETFSFYIVQEGREPFDFNKLSMGFAAVLDIIVDLMMRMETYTNHVFCFDIAGIVLIDEIETHLHLELQKRILGSLTRLFPNIQFIVSTHSPFVLNSIENVTIYDLENEIIVNNGLQDVPYDGIVESYFKVDKLSAELRDKFERYKELTGKHTLTDDDFVQIAELEMYLSEIPDYLALDIATEFLRIKTEFERREDIE